VLEQFFGRGGGVKGQGFLGVVEGPSLEERPEHKKTMPIGNLQNPTIPNEKRPAPGTQKKKTVRVNSKKQGK